MTRFLAFLAIVLCSTAAPLAARPSAAEQRMLATVDAEQGRTLALLEKLVNQNSGSLNLAGVEAVAKMVRAEFEPLGFEVRWIPLKQTGRAGHFVAHHRGKGKRLLLIGHLDTVFEPDSPFQRWRREGNFGHGPGAADDKGGVVTMIAALRAMKAAGTLAGADVTVFLTGDEEDVGLPLAQARGDLIAAGKTADIALDFEGLSIDGGKDMGVVARRGSMNWTVTATSKPAHSSGIFSAASGYGAAYELARILDGFRRELTDDKLTYNVGLMAAGNQAALDADRIRLTGSGKTNIIAAQAIARGDLRALTLAQLDRTQAKMRAIVAASLPGTSATVTFDEDAYPPMAATAGSRALLVKLNRVNADLALAPQAELDPLKRGAGDISFVAGDVDGLIGLGPASSGDHTAEERVVIDSIWRQAKRAAILMSRLGAEKR
ncbi:MAG TPA: M20/M25/M40 family metallo-hydrolase [Sphingomicrobium sp.]|nr:M20/M25/M40 family metallo-hydrolase [Sphingomicrobium sp.]